MNELEKLNSKYLQSLTSVLTDYVGDLFLDAKIVDSRYLRIRALGSCLLISTDKIVLVDEANRKKNFFEPCLGGVVEIILDLTADTSTFVHDVATTVIFKNKKFVVKHSSTLKDIVQFSLFCVDKDIHNRMSSSIQYFFNNAEIIENYKKKVFNNSDKK